MTPNNNRINERDLIVIGTAVPRLRCWAVYANRENNIITVYKEPILFYSVSKYGFEVTDKGGDYDYQEATMFAPVTVDGNYLYETNADNQIGISVEGDNLTTEYWLKEAKEYFDREDRKSKKKT